MGTMDTPLTLETAAQATRQPATGPVSSEQTCHVCWGKGKLLLRQAGRNGGSDRVFWPQCGCCRETGKERA